MKVPAGRPDKVGDGAEGPAGRRVVEEPADTHRPAALASLYIYVHNL